MDSFLNLGKNHKIYQLIYCLKISNLLHDVQ